MPTAVGTFAIKDEVQIRTDGLRTYANYLQLHCGISNPNISPGSDAYARWTALSYELAPLYANCQIQGDALMPDTAQGQDLVRVGASVGLSPRPSAGSVGFVVLATSATTLVPTGAQLVDAAGLIFQVTTGGSYANGALIPIAAASAGSATNHAAGDSLTWQSAPAYAAPTALAANGGLIDGVDAEIDANQENFRARIFTRLQNPAGGGNWTNLAELATNAHPSVQAAFVYPSLLGPGTTMVAVTGFSTWNTQASASRVVNATIVANIVKPFIAGQVSDPYIVVTGTVDSPVDVAFGLALPAAPTASPPGLGGGWLDGTPWPTRKCTVTSVASSSSFTVDAPTPPVVGSHVAWLSSLGPKSWTILSATVVSFSGSSGAYVINLDTPFTGIATGNFIFPQSLQQQAYASAVMNQFALMGPYEETSNVTVLQRAFRHPAPPVSFPYALDAKMLRAVESAGDEVESVSFLYTSAVAGITPPILPPLPATVATPPSVFVPRNIGFYAQ